MKKKGATSVPYGSGYKKMNENKNIKKTIGVFGGRFQPFHSGHLATYKWLSKQVDEAYIHIKYQTTTKTSNGLQRKSKTYGKDGYSKKQNRTRKNTIYC